MIKIDLVVFILYNVCLICRMAFDDFCKYFVQAAICRVVNTSMFSITKTWHEGACHSAWKKPDRAGGCLNNVESFMKNPQVINNTRNDDDDDDLSFSFTL